MSHDQVTATKNEETVTESVDSIFSHPLTKADRATFNELSVKAYGKYTRWQQLMRKGEYEVVTAVTNNGDPIQIKRLKHFTLDQIFSTMKKIINDQEAALVKAKLEEGRKKIEANLEANQTETV